MIRIVKGVYGYRKGAAIVPKDVSSEPFTLAPEEEARLVGLGVAEYIVAVKTPAAAAPQKVEGPGEQTGPRAYSEEMKLATLKEIAVEDYGLPEAEVKKIIAKKDVVAAIDAHRAARDTAPQENGEEDGDPDEAPPVITPEAPVQ